MVITIQYYSEIEARHINIVLNDLPSLHESLSMLAYYYSTQYAMVRVCLTTDKQKHFDKVFIGTWDGEGIDVDIYKFIQTNK